MQPDLEFERKQLTKEAKDLCNRMRDGEFNTRDELDEVISKIQAQCEAAERYAEAMRNFKEVKFFRDLIQMIKLKRQEMS